MGGAQATKHQMAVQAGMGGMRARKSYVYAWRARAPHELALRASGDAGFSRALKRARELAAIAQSIQESARAAHAGGAGGGMYLLHLVLMGTPSCLQLADHELALTPLRRCRHQLPVAA
jgi:hypothetical protein